MPLEGQLPRYKCHKEVWALKITAITKHAHSNPDTDDAAFESSIEFSGAFLIPEDTHYAPIPVDAEWYRKHDPQPGGYYVIYKDGYTSYSPAETFEDGYRRQVSNESSSPPNDERQSDRTAQEIVDQTNELAQKLYKEYGYSAQVAHEFHESRRPREKAMWHMACVAQEHLTGTNPEDALTELEG